jgi:hypothetical protein
VDNLRKMEFKKFEGLKRFKELKEDLGLKG